MSTYSRSHNPQGRVFGIEGNYTQVRISVDTAKHRRERCKKGRRQTHVVREKLKDPSCTKTKAITSIAINGVISFNRFLKMNLCIEDVGSCNIPLYMKGKRLLTYLSKIDVDKGIAIRETKWRALQHACEIYTKHSRCCQKCSVLEIKSLCVLSVIYKTMPGR